MTELLPNLFIGNWREAESSVGLDIVTCMNDEPHFIKGTRFNLIDGPGNELELLQSAIDHVAEEYKKGKKILVHCHGGRSRSATVSVGAIAKITNRSLCQAYDFVKDRHEITRIHPYLSLLLMEIIK